MAKKHKHHHTGPAHHDDMHMLNAGYGMGTKDPHAHESHHAANKEAGMGTGMHHADHYYSEDEQGGEGMQDNCCDET